MRETMNNVLVVYKKGVAEFYDKSKDDALIKFMNSDDPDVPKMRRSAELQKRTLEVVLSELDKRKIKYNSIYRANLNDVKDNDLIITVGGDGTFLELSHYLKNPNIPVLAVNSDPVTGVSGAEGSIGFFSCATKDNFGDVLDNIDTIKKNRLQRFALYKNGILIPEYMLNDVLFANIKPAGTTRLRVNGENKIRHSGLLVGTSAGSTAFIYQEGGFKMPLDDHRLQYCIRSVRNKTFEFANELRVESLSRKAEFSIDGEHVVYDFEIGSVVEIKKAEPITLLGNLDEKREKYI